MAERTGVPSLDAVIEAFLERGRWHVPMRDWFEDRYIDQPRPLTELKSALGARGKCVHLTEEFNSFAEECGLEALSPADEEGRQTAVPPEALGYADRSLSGLSSHTFSILPWEGSLYSVDWTAAQYGYQSFPLVQRFGEEDWQRDWQREPVEMSVASAA